MVKNGAGVLDDSEDMLEGLPADTSMINVFAP